MPPVVAARGQILVLRMPSKDTLRYPVHARDLYYTPRADGRLLVGSTLEEGVWEPRLEPRRARQFLERLERLVPRAPAFPAIDGWAGLRPKGPDPYPMLGPTDLENVAVAAAHFRSGILLAPETGVAMADYLLEGELPASAAPFTIERF